MRTSPKFMPKLNKAGLLTLLLMAFLLGDPGEGFPEEMDTLAVFLMGVPEEDFPPQNNTLREVVRKAIATSPEVNASWEALNASIHEQDVARGGYFPRLDLSGRTGYEEYKGLGGDSDFAPAEASVSLNQMLFDGFATRNEVRRLGNEKLASFFELLAESEATALEVVKAYTDILRYRELLGFAEENLREHERIHAQVRERVQAGVGRGVDLQQATGRLALAKSNRITEANNLHDVSTRFLRLTGQLPQASLDPPTDLSREAIPSDIQMTLRRAFLTNPSFNAAIEKVRAAEKARQGRKSPFMPRLDLRAHHDRGDDRDQIEGHSNESVVELALNFNLFRGGSDMAALKQFKRQVNQAVDLREKSCRDVRQTLTIAYNDIKQLESQLQHLQLHQISSANAREAYQHQFEIGQRTLLDLLDTENEYFQARRAYSNASYDYILAHARTLAGMGQLLTALGLREENLPALSSLGEERNEINPENLCPAQAVPEMLYDSGVSVDAPSAAAAFAPELDSDQDADGIPLSRDMCPDTPPGVSVDAAGCPGALPAIIPTAAGITASPVIEKVQQIDVRFDFGNSRIPEKFNAQIARLAELLKKHPRTSLLLEGHTDSTGPQDYNKILSRDRVEAVRNRLMSTHGIPPDRIYVSWFKSDNPVADNQTAEGRALNRRVEAHVSIILKGVVNN